MTGGALAAILALIVAGRLIGVTAPPPGDPIAVRVAFATAFVGGVLSLMSPCAGAVLPAFFAYSFRSVGRLVPMTYVFYLGLAVVFVPLGFASSLVAGLVADHADAIYLVAGALLVGLGLATLAGIDLGQVTRLAGRDPSTVGQARVASAGSETARVFALGTVFGFATSSCTAPIIGAMATLAVGAGLSSLHAMLLFLVFALGIVAPLFVLAFLFERRPGLARRLAHARPWTLRLGRWTHAFHPVHAVTGIVLVVLGVVFATTRGTLDLTLYYDRWGLSERYAEWTLGFSEFLNASPVAAAVVTFVVVAGVVAFVLRRRARRQRGGA